MPPSREWGVALNVCAILSKARLRILIGIAAAFLAALTPFSVAAEGAAPTVLVGAIRWDNWRLDSAAGDDIADPAYVNRIPYYAWRKPDGSLGFPGDMKNILSADVAYARAGGIDYFIFGYYLETGSWGRNAVAAKALNRAYHAYLDLPDRAGVKFALSFNWSFPVKDVPAVSDAIIEAAKRPDQVRTADGAAVVFFFTPNLENWAKGLGGEDGAQWALADIRRRVADKTGARVYFVSLLFGIEHDAPLAERVGFDAVSTYANALGGGGRAVPYATCSAQARNFWRKGGILRLGFLPTVTIGWDYRPLIKRPGKHPDRDSNASWCMPGSDQQWTDQIRAAQQAASADPANGRLKSVVFYAWNEFAEGGWIEPTVGEGTHKLDVIRRALGRNIPPRRVELSWPRRSPQDGLTMDWPCPPGSHEKKEINHSAPQTTGYAAREEWQTRVCD